MLSNMKRTIPVLLDGLSSARNVSVGQKPDPIPADTSAQHLGPVPRPAVVESRVMDQMARAGEL